MSGDEYHVLLLPYNTATGLLLRVSCPNSHNCNEYSHNCNDYHVLLRPTIIMSCIWDPYTILLQQANN